MANVLALKHIEGTTGFSFIEKPSLITKDFLYNAGVGSGVPKSIAAI